MIIPDFTVCRCFDLIFSFGDLTYFFDEFVDLFGSKCLIELLDGGPVDVSYLKGVLVFDELLTSLFVRMFALFELEYEVFGLIIWPIFTLLLLIKIHFAVKFICFLFLFHL